MPLIDDGIYEGKVKNYGLTENIKGEPVAFIDIGFTVRTFDGRSDDCVLTWTGSFASEKAAQYTKKTLKSLGMKTNDVRELATGTESNQIELGTAVKITTETKTSKKGKKFSVIKYLNSMNGKKFNTISADKLAKLAWVKDLKDPKDPSSGDLPF